MKTIGVGVSKLKSKFNTFAREIKYTYQSNTNTYMKNMFGNKYIACRSMNEVGQFMTTTLRREIVRVMKR